MENPEIIKSQNNLIKDQGAKIKELEKKLAKAEAEKTAIPVTSLNVSEADTAQKEAKTVTYQAGRTIKNAIYPSRQLATETVKATDTKRIRELEGMGYKKLS